MTRKEHLIDTFKLLDLAKDDLDKLGTFLVIEKINDQFYRRLFLRNIYSVIEIFLSVTKEILKIKVSIEGLNDNVSWTELVILNEKKVFLDDKGKVKTKNDFQNFEQSFRFTLNTFAKTFNCESPDYSSENYQYLIKLSKRRNDITHPRVLKDQIITDQELQETVVMMAWFVEIQGRYKNEIINWLNDIKLLKYNR